MQQVIYVRQLLVENFQKNQADLISQSLKVEAFEHRPQMFFAPGLKAEEALQVPRNQLQFTGRNLREGAWPSGPHFDKTTLG